MNNKVIMLIFIIANIEFGVLIYGLFIAKEPISILSLSSIGLILGCFGFYSYSITNFIKNNKKQSKNKNDL